MKVIQLAHLDKFFTIKSATGQNANDETAAEPVSEPEPQASENVDLSPNEDKLKQMKLVTTQVKKHNQASREMTMVEMMIKSNLKGKC